MLFDTSADETLYGSGTNKSPNQYVGADKARKDYVRKELYKLAPSKGYERHDLGFQITCTASAGLLRISKHSRESSGVGRTR